MTGLAAVRALGPVDLKSVWRDPMRRWMAFLPLALALVARWFLPPLLGRLSQWIGHDLGSATVPLVSCIMLMIAPVITGNVIGFLLLDHRDEGTLAALEVTPLRLGGYLAYRLSVPMAVAFAATLLMFPLAGIGVHWLPAVLGAFVAAPMAPLSALVLGAFARNKVQGFALMKAAGAVLWPPLFAFFVPLPWQLLFGVSPVYWPARVYWSALAGDANWALWAVPGLAWQGLLIWLLLRRYHRVAER